MIESPLAIVTGASGGIGGCLARQLAQRGCRLLLMGRNAHALEALQQEIGPAVLRTLSLDLAEVDAIALAVKPVLAEIGPAQVLVNNAGCGIYQPFIEQTAEQHHRLFAVNYLAAAQMTRLVLPAMLEQGDGRVINIASVSAKVGPWGHAGYAGAKAALVSLTETLAAEHAGSGVHFSYVNPGIVTTDYFAQAQMGDLWSRVRRYAIEPDRVARRVASLLDRPRLELCVPWHHRALDWLRAISPTLVHRIVARHSRPETGASVRVPAGSHKVPARPTVETDPARR